MYGRIKKEGEDVTMLYKKKLLSLEDAKIHAQTLSYGLVYQFNRILIGSVEQVKDKIQWDECLEARFFSEKEEVHFFERNGIFAAVSISDETEETTCTRTKNVKLKPLFATSGWNEMVIKEYIAFDEDGQAYIELTRLAGLMK